VTNEDIERINMMLLLCVNLVTVLKNAYSLHALMASHRSLKGEVRRRLDDLESHER